MKKPTVLRKRYIPFETVDISGDELISRSDELLVTRWKPIKIRSDRPLPRHSRPHRSCRAEKALARNELSRDLEFVMAGHRAWVGN